MTCDSMALNIILSCYSVFLILPIGKSRGHKYAVCLFKLIQAIYLIKPIVASHPPHYFMFSESRDISTISSYLKAVQPQGVLYNLEVRKGFLSVIASTLLRHDNSSSNSNLFICLTNYVGGMQND